MAEVRNIESSNHPWLKNYPNEMVKSIPCPEVPLFELLSKAVNEQPKKTAIIYLDKEISYQDLGMLSDKFSAALRQSGVNKGDRVAIFLPNTPQFIIAYFGILKAGAVLTPISPLHREREIEYQLRDSGAETIIVLDTLFNFVEVVWRKTKLKRAIVTSISEADKASAQETIRSERNIVSFHEFLEIKPQHFNVKIDPAEDLASLQYTGGTTGIPKAAMLSHRNLSANAFAFARWIYGEASDVFLVALPLFHIYGMTTSLNVPVALGAKMVVLPRYEPAKVLESIQQHKVTVYCGSPTMYQMLLENANLNRFKLDSIRVCISGASPLPPNVQKTFMEITGGLLAEGYGLTEASPVTHCNPVDKTMKTVRVGSIGLPLPGTDARIVDAESGERALGVGEIGELAVRGPQVMKGYWQRPDETALVIRGGWLLTGDLAWMDADGYFFISERKKDLIKYKDYSVYPREIEDILYEHPAVKLCAVIGKPEPKVGEIPKAFVVLKEGATASKQEMTTFVNGKVAPYKAIRELEFRSQLPLSSAGKILRRALREEELSPK